MIQGIMESGFFFTCAICCRTDMYPGTSDVSKQEAREKGWGLTKELGWVCLNCQQNSEPLRKLLPESDQIIKDQPISE